ncbi:MAG: methylated-DNA--[protein]-cysteine S-methyltransferase [Saprospiraceae bacterium]|nr:methylated-DNA--[protein]-cysteine S-methyltransferase [Saprospiraceae bacterium]
MEDVGSGSYQYQRIAEIVRFLRTNFKEHHSLSDLSEQFHLSPFHLQRTFREWVGLTPKQFQKFLSVDFAKGLLKKESPTLQKVAFDTGLSGTGRLHDLFVSIESMSPGQFKYGGQDLKIYHSIHKTPFGMISVASTDRGVCHLTFLERTSDPLDILTNQFPNARITSIPPPDHKNVVQFFDLDWQRPDRIKLHLRGTPFQIKVWEALLRIPQGQLRTYGDLATQIGHPDASRAVGNAIGRNPVGYIIPCHRVIRSTGALGGYRWGQDRKAAIIGYENARIRKGHIQDNESSEETF